MRQPLPACRTTQVTASTISYPAYWIIETWRPEDPADLAVAVIAAEQAFRGRELLDTVITSLFRVGLSLQVAKDLPTELTGPIIEAALGHLDDTIKEIRDATFTTPLAVGSA